GRGRVRVGCPRTRGGRRPRPPWRTRQRRSLGRAPRGRRARGGREPGPPRPGRAAPPAAATTAAPGASATRRASRAPTGTAPTPRAASAAPAGSAGARRRVPRRAATGRRGCGTSGTSDLEHAQGERRGDRGVGAGLQGPHEGGAQLARRDHLVDPQPRGGVADVEGCVVAGGDLASQLLEGLGVDLASLAPELRRLYVEERA